MARGSRARNEGNGNDIVDMCSFGGGKFMAMIVSGEGPVPVRSGLVSTWIDPMHRGLASLEGPPSLLSQRPKRSLQGLYRD